MPFTTPSMMFFPKSPQLIPLKALMIAENTCGNAATSDGIARIIPDMSAPRSSIPV